MISLFRLRLDFSIILGLIYQIGSIELGKITLELVKSEDRLALDWYCLLTNVRSLLNEIINKLIHTFSRLSFECIAMILMLSFL